MSWYLISAQHEVFEIPMKRVFDLKNDVWKDWISKLSNCICFFISCIRFANFRTKLKRKQVLQKKGTVSYILEFQVQLWLISQQYCSLMLDTRNYMANDSLMIKENLFEAIYFCLFLGVIYPMTEHLTSDLPSAWLLPYVSSM